MNIDIVPINLPKGTQFILGQGTFNILTVELLYQAVGSAIPNSTFGIAMCEGSDGRLVRTTGNADDLSDLAAETVQKIGCGHIFLVLFDGAFPLQVLPALRGIPTVVQIFAATGNPSLAFVARMGEQGAVVGVADGYCPLRRETREERAARRRAIRSIGYAETD